MDNTIRDENIPRPDEGLRLLDLAENNLNLEKDMDLLAQIWNNRLYYYIAKNQIQNITQLQANLAELEQIQIRIEPNENLWPSFVLDTLAWGEWVLYFDDVRTAPDRKNKIIQRLKQARSSKEINEHERQIRINHLEAVLANSNVIILEKNTNPKKN